MSAGAFGARPRVRDGFEPALGDRPAAPLALPKRAAVDPLQGGEHLPLDAGLQPEQLRGDHLLGGPAVQLGGPERVADLAVARGRVPFGLGGKHGPYFSGPVQEGKQVAPEGGVGGLGTHEILSVRGRNEGWAREYYHTLRRGR